MARENDATRDFRKQHEGGRQGHLRASGGASGRPSDRAGESGEERGQNGKRPGGQNAERPGGRITGSGNFRFDAYSRGGAAGRGGRDNIDVDAFLGTLASSAYSPGLDLTTEVLSRVSGAGALQVRPPSAVWLTSA